MAQPHSYDLVICATVNEAGADAVRGNKLRHLLPNVLSEMSEIVDKRDRINGGE